MHTCNGSTIAVLDGREQVGCVETRRLDDFAEPPVVLREMQTGDLQTRAATCNMQLVR